MFDSHSARELLAAVEDAHRWDSVVMARKLGAVARLLRLSIDEAMARASPRPENGCVGADHSTSITRYRNRHAREEIRVRQWPNNIRRTRVLFHGNSTADKPAPAHSAGGSTTPSSPKCSHPTGNHRRERRPTPTKHHLSDRVEVWHAGGHDRAPVQWQ